jgi:short subunit dehydrogenase-like uncharacterized protein
MAGRNPEKLNAVRDALNLPSGTPVIAADITDAASIEAMVQRTKVVITTVGPYQLYGEALLAACASYGTNYVDLCGEPLFMREMIETYDARAKKSGARIVHSCGYDSIPFDMGVFLLQKEAERRFGAPIKDVKCRVRSQKGEFSGGTALSGAETVKRAKKDRALMASLLSPFALTPGFKVPQQPPSHKPYFDEELGSWAAPFEMAIINTKNVHRSNMLMGHAYGEEFTYQEMIATGPGDSGEAMALKIASMDTEKMTAHLKSGDGPDKAARESGHFDLLFTGTSDDGERVSVSVGDNRDPGYGSTSKMISEAALCLIEDVPRAKPGILTPAAAFGDAIIHRLKTHAGLRFEIET